MKIETYLQQLQQSPLSISFEYTISIIDTHYQFTPTAFTNGQLANAENENNGSCKIFAFARLQNLTPEQTLHCFGDYYRKDVQQNPNGENHLNIRNFISTQWTGISFSGSALTVK